MPIVVGVAAVATTSPAESTSAALVNVEPKSTQSSRATGSPVAQPSRSEGLLEVLDEVLDVLDAGGQADQVGGHLELRATDRACVIRAGCSMSDSTPPRDSPSVQTGGLAADLDRDVLASADLERDHPAEPLHLAGGHLVARVPLEAGVVHGAHGRVAEEELDDALGVVAVLLHAQRERLEATQHEPRVERAGDGTDRVLMERDRDRRRRRTPSPRRRGRRPRRHRRRRCDRRSTSSSSA